MTTPEKFRRRQRGELILVLFVLIGSLGYAIYDSNQQKARDLCMVTSFHNAGVVQRKRAHLFDQSQQLQQRIDHVQNLEIEAQSTVIEDIAAASDSDDVARAFVQWHRAEDTLTDVKESMQRRLAAVEVRRSHTKPMKFPSGKCS